MIGRVPPGAFFPPPKVESAIVRVTERPDPATMLEEEARFRGFVRAAFGMRRKQMRRVLRSVAALDAERADALLAQVGNHPEARPETLTAAQFAAIVRTL